MNKNNLNKPGSDGVIYSPSYPRPETISKLTRRRTRNIAFTGFALLLLLITFYFELEFIGRHFIGVIALFNINIILLLLLLVLIFRNIIKLVIERKRQAAGSRFRTKLVFAFVVLSMIPTVFLVTVGSNLMAEAIRSWFDPTVEQFVDSSMEVARQAHLFTEEYMTNSARNLSKIISTESLLMGESGGLLARAIQTHQTENNLALIQLFNSKGEEVFRGTKTEYPSGVFYNSSDKEYSEVLSGKEFTAIKSLVSGQMLQKGVPIFSSEDPGKIVGVLILSLFQSQDFTHNLRNIQRNYEAYKQQKLSIRPTQGLYISIFVTFALTVLFGAVWLGIYIARQISIPISHLMQATDDVARGNLDVQVDIIAFDEIGSLVMSFNRMIQELRMNKSVIDRSTREIQQTNLEIQKRQNQLETILRNIGAGVISVDLTGKITTINQKAANILQISETEAINRSFEDAFGEEYLRELRELLKVALTDRLEEIEKEIQIQTHRRLSSCSASFAPLRDANGGFCGVVVVIDDLTQIIRMQRVAAWREVARRLAHEIKNPLTPIQLNAQRLQRKFETGALDFPAVFKEATNSIIQEVNGIRVLLDEFSQYARLPEAQLRSGHIHDIIDQSLTLYAGSSEGVTITTSLDPAMPRMMLDHEQMKRVFINIIDNAIEAMQGGGDICISSRFDALKKMAQIKISDNGPGIPAQDKEKIFLPHFSTKERGSGLGLAICQRIVADHNGILKVFDNQPNGTVFSIEMPVYSDMKEEI